MFSANFLALVILCLFKTDKKTNAFGPESDEFKENKGSCSILWLKPYLAYFKFILF